MKDVIELRKVTKRFGKANALESLSLSVPPRSIIGLVGRNGSGKTTLLRHVVGLLLPTSGECSTFGVPTRDLDAPQLERIGFAQQRTNFLDWMRAGQLIRYVSAFYPRWDTALEKELVSLLDIDLEQRINVTSPGNVQKLSMVLATCHHPELLLLDEPLSDLDPIARRDVIATLLDRFESDNVTMVISSHLLYDLERIADRIVCLEKGKLVEDASLDDLKESFAEWIVTSHEHKLPASYDRSWVLRAEGNAVQARLIVRWPAKHIDEFRSRFAADVVSHPLGLDAIFPLLIGDSPRDGSPKREARLVEAAK
ncbi:MAG TPA: ABC transporter ATP-binding protein [Gemmatimonadaceae bacterium]|nr:ABC transporter ATP-binding protein [Gemmatimonadaceae bacterium]